MEESKKKQNEEMVFVFLGFFLLAFLILGLVYEQAHSWVLDKIAIYKILQPNQCLNSNWQEIITVDEKESGYEC